VTPDLLPHPSDDDIAEIFTAFIQTFYPSRRNYRAAARHFLAFLQISFPQPFPLSTLRRDPHLLGWLRHLRQQDPPLAVRTRRVYVIVLRRMLRELAAQGHSLPADLILIEDFSPHPRKPSTRKRRPPNLPPNPPRFPLHPLFHDIFQTHIHKLAATLRPRSIRIIRVVARRFLAYLRNDFPQLTCLSDLCRDPHLLGWARHLAQQDPPLALRTRHTYLLQLRQLLRDLAANGQPLRSGLILREDIPWRPPPTIPRPFRYPQTPPHAFQEIFNADIQTLATTLRPSTVENYRLATRCFLSFLQSEFPHLLQLADLRRDPHLCAWLRHLCQKTPPRSNSTRQKYILDIRRLLQDLAAQGQPLPPGLILSDDIPPRPHYLPRAISPEEDQRLQQELRHTDDLYSNALLLTRATGLRIGECIDLSSDCLRSLGQNQWALHVPLGKLKTERLVPVDDDVRQILARILTLRQLDPRLERSASFLLPRRRSRQVLYSALSQTLRQAADRAGCAPPVNCHRLRHTYATEMLRLGVSLPALMQLLGHTDIRMTLRYVQVTQADLQREFQLARQTPVPHLVPQLSLPDPLSATADLPGIRRALAATRHLLEMYRRQLADHKASAKLRRLLKRLLTVDLELDRLATDHK
jgi:site-specific recombinase XerD